jgi:hypothetical protein
MGYWTVWMTEVKINGITVFNGAIKAIIDTGTSYTILSNEIVN